MSTAMKARSDNQSTAVRIPLSDEDWSFSDLKRVETLWGPHGYHRYPAKFIPQLVRRIIESYSARGSRVGDPFLGSATTGIEALRSGRNFWGADINPVARLISQAKCTPIDPKVLSASWQRLDEQLAILPRIGRRTLTEQERTAILSINIARASSEQRLAYWFPAAHSTVLKQLLDLVTSLPDEAIRTFYLCAFSNILRNCSIWLSGSTKPQKDIEKTLSDPMDAFRRQARDMIKRNSLYWADLTEASLSPSNITEQCIIDLQDARSLPLADGQLDLIVTSPPYATCYQYLEIHQLTQLWFEKHNLLNPIDLRHTCIGGKGVSNREERDFISSTGSGTADKVLLKLKQLGRERAAIDVDREVRALRYYFQDMRAVMNELARVVARGKHLVLIVGDSFKRGITIPTSAALCDMAIESGFNLERRIVRKVPVRVLVSTRDKSSGRFSSARESDTQAYPEEDVLIFRRAAVANRKGRRPNG
jgi:DNA modification methylase